MPVPRGRLLGCSRVVFAPGSPFGLERSGVLALVADMGDSHLFLGYGGQSPISGYVAMSGEAFGGATTGHHWDFGYNGPRSHELTLDT